MKVLIVLILIALSINISSCTKDSNDGGVTTSSSTTSTTSAPDDYRAKYRGDYKCTGIKTFYGRDSSEVTTEEELTVAVNFDVRDDSSMTFISKFNIGNWVYADGKFKGKDSNSYGRFFSNDSIYLYLYYFGHQGDTEWKIAGKR
jgi:hypothetical protein